MIKRIKSEYAETTQVRVQKSLNSKGDLLYIQFEKFSSIIQQHFSILQESGNAMLIQLRCILQKLRDNPEIQLNEINMIYKEEIVDQ